MRKIIYVDMDAFYASIEQRDNPKYRSKPLALGYSGETRLHRSCRTGVFLSDFKQHADMARFLIAKSH